jgi:ketosteroid isomerase-like protein
MSEENVELVRRIYERWDRGQSAAQLLATDIEYVNPSYAVEPGTRYGRKSFAIVRDTYEDFELRVESYLDAGDDVVVLAHYKGTGRGSGVPVAGEQGYVWTLRDGLAVRFQWYQSHREALEAAGLSAASADDL